MKHFVAFVALTMTCYVCAADSKRHPAGPPAAGPMSEENEPAEIQIGLSPEAARQSEIDQKIEYYRGALNGDASARKKWDEFKTPQRVALLAELAIKIEKSEARKHAIAELARMTPGVDSEGKGIAALGRIAVTDEGSMRELARKALSARGDTRIIGPLADVALNHKDAQFRDNAVAALNDIGGPAVYEAVIERWSEVIAGAGPRTHVAFGNVRSYISNYEISGDAYDPVVRQFITGVVLDTKVLSVERVVYIVTLRKLAGADVKGANTPAAWQQWLVNERPRLLKEGAEKHRAAIAALTELAAPITDE